MSGTDAADRPRASTRVGRAMAVAGAVLFVAYPFLIFAGLVAFEPRAVAGALVVLFGARALVGASRHARAGLRDLLGPGLLVGAVLLAALLSNDERALFLLPVAVNVVLLYAFGRTLRPGRTPMIETFARLQDPDLGSAEIAHCRSFTRVWCVFFAANAALTGALAIWASAWVWTLYTGLLAYVAMGLVFAAEFVLRAWRFGRYEGSVFEPIFRRVFRQRAPTPREGA